jgi:ankyrin repeat protein
MIPDAINQVDNWRKTSLHYAVINNNNYIVKLLLKRGADNKASDHCNKTILHYAVINKNEDMAELLLPKMTIKSITQRSISGKTVLHYASKLNCKYFIKLLLEKGVEIINQFDNNGWTALHTALYNREVKKDLIELLLKNGADINYRSESGLTLLHYAVLSCNKDIIKLLLKEMSLDLLNQTAEGGHTVLHYAIGIMRQDIIELLLDSGVNINKASNDSIPLLPYSIQTGRKDIVELFLDKMSLDLINQVDSSGKTGLHLAAILNKQDIVKFLIDSGKCDVTIRDKMGNHIFSSYSMGHVYNREMKDLLMKYSLQDTDNDNKSLENTTNYYKTENYCIFQSLYKDMETIYELPEENNSPTSLGLVITDIEQT